MSRRKASDLGDVRSSRPTGWSHQPINIQIVSLEMTKFAMMSMAAGMTIRARVTLWLGVGKTCSSPTASLPAAARPGAPCPAGSPQPPPRLMNFKLVASRTTVARGAAVL